MPPSETNRTTPGTEQRRHPRVPLPAGYAPVRVHLTTPESADPIIREGHAYDVSRSGVRFELDQPLHRDQPVILELQLPGPDGPTVRAGGRVVRHHDPDEVGPIRMAVQFDRFETPAEPRKIDTYVRHALPRAG